MYGERKIDPRASKNTLMHRNWVSRWHTLLGSRKANLFTDSSGWKEQTLRPIESKLCWNLCKLGKMLHVELDAVYIKNVVLKTPDERWVWKLFFILSPPLSNLKIFSLQTHASFICPSIRNHRNMWSIERINKFHFRKSHCQAICFVLLPFETYVFLDVGRRNLGQFRESSLAI